LQRSARHKIPMLSGCRPRRSLQSKRGYGKSLCVTVIVSPSQRARALRQRQTDAERLLWSRLRARQLDGIKFRRQFPIGPFFADFCSTERKIVIELDGGQHAEQLPEDAERTRRIAELGYRMLRFWNNDVLENIDGVLESIREFLSGC